MLRLLAVDLGVYLLCQVLISGHYQYQFSIVDALSALPFLQKRAAFGGAIMAPVGALLLVP